MSGVGGSIFSRRFDSNAERRGLRRSECMETWDKECENRMERVNSCSGDGFRERLMKRRRVPTGPCRFGCGERHPAGDLS
ncbi:uncharacterized [Tachysurus ichikawai]